MKLSQKGEFGLLQLLNINEVDLPDGWIGPGDDCALFPGSDGHDQLVTTDMLVEGVHFLTDPTTPEEIGYKALAVNLSDLAAMGARPLAYTLAAGLPGDLHIGWVQQLYKGLNRCAQRYGCPLVGGDTTRSDRVVLSITAMGIAPTGEAILRSTARPGDDLYVSGTLGDSAGGLRLLQEEHAFSCQMSKWLLLRHTTPKPRLALGEKLREKGLATAMIDISDGLVQDAGHIASMSGVCIQIFTGGIPLSESLNHFFGGMWNDPWSLDFALGGGEDYELCFTAPASAREAVLKAASEADTPISRIGCVREQQGKKANGVELLDREGKAMALPGAVGFDHFR